MKTDRDDPTDRLSYLSELSARQSDPIKKIKLLLEYLETYIDKGGTLKTWAFNHFRELCSTIENLQDVDPGFYVHRVNHIVVKLTEILKNPNLRKELPKNTYYYPDQQNQISTVLPLEGRFAILNYLLLKIDLYFATQSTITSNFLKNISRDLVRLGFIYGELKMGTIRYAWTPNQTESETENIPNIKEEKQGHPPAEKTIYFPPRDLDLLNSNYDEDFGLVHFHSKDNKFYLSSLIKDELWTRSKYQHLISIICGNLMKRCQQDQLDNS